MTADLAALPATFFDMEVAEDLFTAQMNDGTYYWDLIRHDVFAALYVAFGGPFAATPPIFEASLASATKDAVKKTLNRSTRAFLVARRPDYIFYTAQRTRIGARVVDTVADPVLDLVADSAIAIETMNKDSVRPAGMLFGGRTRVPPPYIYTTPRSENVDGPAEHVSTTLKRYFSRPIDVHSLVREQLAVYWQYRDYFLALLSRHRPKAIVVNNNGLLKGLFAAARSMGVPTLELQHGAPTVDSPFWSYPKCLSSSHPGLTLPSAYLTFADYWKDATNYPVKETHTIGNDYLHQEVVATDVGSVAIISAYMYQEELASLAVSLAELFPTRTIYFKLHPHQFSQKATIGEQVSGHPTIRVLSDEMSLSELFASCTFVIGVHSTVLYSALQARKKVMIFKRATYRFHHDIFDFVELFDDVHEAQQLIQTHNERFSQLDQAPQFFAPFDPAACLEALGANDSTRRLARREVR